MTQTVNNNKEEIKETKVEDTKVEETKVEDKCCENSKVEDSKIKGDCNECTLAKDENEDLKIEMKKMNDKLIDLDKDFTQYKKDNFNTYKEQNTEEENKPYKSVLVYKDKPYKNQF